MSGHQPASSAPIPSVSAPPQLPPQPQVNIFDDDDGAETTAIRSPYADEMVGTDAAEDSDELEGRLTLSTVHKTYARHRPVLRRLVHCALVTIVDPLVQVPPAPQLPAPQEQKVPHVVRRKPILIHPRPIQPHDGLTKMVTFRAEPSVWLYEYDDVADDEHLSAAPSTKTDVCMTLPGHKEILCRQTPPASVEEVRQPRTRSKSMFATGRKPPRQPVSSAHSAVDDVDPGCITRPGQTQKCRPTPPASVEEVPQPRTRSKSMFATGRKPPRQPVASAVDDIDRGCRTRPGQKRKCRQTPPASAGEVPQPRTRSQSTIATERKPPRQPVASAVGAVDEGDHVGMNQHKRKGRPTPPASAGKVPQPRTRSKSMFATDRKPQPDATSVKTKRGRPRKVREAHAAADGGRSSGPPTSESGASNSAQTFESAAGQLMRRTSSDSCDFCGFEEVDDDNEVALPALPASAGEVTHPRTRSKSTIATERKPPRQPVASAVGAVDEDDHGGMNQHKRKGRPTQPASAGKVPQPRIRSKSMFATDRKPPRQKVASAVGAVDEDDHGGIKQHKRKGRPTPPASSGEVPQPRTRSKSMFATDRKPQPDATSVKTKRGRPRKVREAHTAADGGRSSCPLTSESGASNSAQTLELQAGQLMRRTSSDSSDFCGFEEVDDDIEVALPAIPSQNEMHRLLAARVEILSSQFGHLRQPVAPPDAVELMTRSDQSSNSAPSWTSTMGWEFRGFSSDEVAGYTGSFASAIPARPSQRELRRLLAAHVQQLGVSEIQNCARATDDTKVQGGKMLRRSKRRQTICVRQT